MLHRGAADGQHHHGHGLGAQGTSLSTKVLLAVAPSPRLGNPTRWGWPLWLAPSHRAGGHRPNHRPLEDYG
jgi:hypothetical protein